MKTHIISEIIRNVLDARGIELTYSDTDAVAEAIIEYIGENK